MRKTTKFPALVFLSLCLALAGPGLGAQNAAAQGVEAQRPDFLQSDPGFAPLGSLPDPLDLPSLERAALLASGLTPERSAAYESRLQQLFDALRAETGAIADPAARGEAILGFLHGGTLKAYGENATTLDGILDTGAYNCVSSAVLYMLAARSLGLQVEGVRTSDHAFCTLRVGDRLIDVETTNPYGFDPGNKKEFKDSFGRATGFAYVAPGSYGDRRAIGDRALVGLILSNRASLLERAGRFGEATRLGADYDELCRDADSGSFLVDRVHNLVAAMESRRDFVGAEAAARAAAAALPGVAQLASLARAVAYNRAAALAQSGDWAGAFDLATALVADSAAAATGGLSSSGAASAAGGDSSDPRATSELVAASLAGIAQKMASAGDYAGARRAVAERSGRAGEVATNAANGAIGEIELVRAANGLPFAEATSTADRVLAAGEITSARYGQAMSAIYGNEAARIGSGGDWLGAAALAQAGIAKLGAAKVQGDGGLGRLVASLRHNFAADAHNRFARLYNSGDYAGAAAAIEKALASLPGDQGLERDLATARSAQAR